MTAARSLDPCAERRPRLSRERVEEALDAAGRAARDLVGPDPLPADLPADFGAIRRRLFHAIGDAQRRSLLVRLLVEEHGRLDHERDTSLGRPRAARSAVLLGPEGGDVAAHRARGPSRSTEREGPAR